MANCFVDQNVENVDQCPHEETVAGVSVDLFYIPKDQVATMALPKVTNTTKYEDRIKLPANSIVPVAQKGWKKVTVMVDENELGTSLVGNKGNKKNKAEIDVYVPNFKTKNLGFMDANKNTPMIYAIADSTGQKWVIGTKNAPAYFETAEAKTGKKAEDNSGITAKITANTKLYALMDDIVVLPDA